MANYANLLATIATNIYTNNNNEVTAAMVKSACDAIVSGLGTMRGYLPSSDLDDVHGNGSWILIDANTYQNVPNNSAVGFLRVSAIEEGRWYLQEFYSFDGGGLYKRRNAAAGTTWEAWQRVSDTGMRGYLPSSDLNDVTSFGTWLLLSDNTYQNVPNNSAAGFLRVSPCGNYILQEFYTFTRKELFSRHLVVGGVPTQWDKIGRGSNITNNYTFPEYSQVVNVSANPSITVDTNNYLASTGDNTDRTADILAMLSTTGACHLGPGVFYIKDLQMPEGTSIIGSGMATRVYMLAGNGFAIKMGSRCQVKDFRLFGTTSTYTPVSTVGNRHGILWQGDYTQSQTAPVSSIISDIFIKGFNGGGITCYDTGYGTNDFLACTNVVIENCDAGINVSYWSEFHKFTNIRTWECYYGCINNGGNNVYTNCDFSRCVVGFLMDNSQGQSPNNSHGSAIGCVFNHSDNNAGTGVRILNCDNGFIFSACQIFFSKIDVQDSDGVVFQGCNFGQANCDISVNGGGVVLFANNMHQGTPPSITITGNTNVHFVNCYNRATGAPISA